MENWVFLVESGLVFGAVLAWAVWQVISVSRDDGEDDR